MKYITTKDFASLSPIKVTHKEWDKTPIPKSEKENLHIIFQKKLYLEKKESYRLKITADDYYKLYINKAFIAMGPAPSHPNHLNFNEFDVTDYLTSGENLITVHVYYQGLLNRAYNSGDNRCALGFELYESEKLICQADESFLYHYDNHYTNGGKTGYDTQFLENLDFTLYDEEIYSGKKQGENAISISTDYILESSPAPLITLESIKPKSVKVLSDSENLHEIFIDFGREYVGYPAFTMEGKQGDTLTLLCGEETDETGLRPKSNMRCSCNYKEILTMSGNVDVVDFFEYKAFRYMTLKGKNVANYVNVDEIKLLARHAPYENNGAKLNSGEPLLHDIWNLCEHTAHFATQEGFLDCPTREKGQYLGDFTVSGLAQMYLSGDPAMYKKTLFDFGKSAEICPGLMAVYPGSLMQEIADFSLQYPLQVLNYYNYTKDEKTALALLPVIENILCYFKKYEREDGLLVGVTEKWNLVDWPQNLRDGYDFELTNPIGKDAFHNVINAFYVGAHICAEKLGKLLGKPLKNRSEALSKAFNKAFFNKESGLYTDSGKSSHSSLHSNVLPVFFGFAPPESFAPIKAMIEEKRLCCGVQFSYFVLLACGEMGAYDLEYSLITDRGDHSWCNMLREGATTLFEAWGKDQKWNTSLCHPWASAPVIALCRHWQRMQSHGIDVAIDGFELKVRE